MNKLKFSIMIAIIIALLPACSQTETIHYCAKCGTVTTNMVAGSKMSMENMGIPTSRLEKVNSTVYRAYLCDRCTGPVIVGPGLVESPD